MAMQMKSNLGSAAAFRHGPTLHRVHMVLASLPLLLLLGACGTAPPLVGTGQASLPVLRGWFEGEEVFYVTTDVSHADVAEAKGANFAPRLADALPAGPPVPGRRSSVDKVYAVTNFKQESIFASAPFPMGSASRDTACPERCRASASPGPGSPNEDGAVPIHRIAAAPLIALRPGQGSSLR